MTEAFQGGIEDLQSQTTANVRRKHVGFLNLTLVRTGSSLDESESGQIFDGDGHATHGISFKSACEINSMSFGQRHEAKVVTPAKDTSDGSMSDVSSISDSGEGQLEDNVLCKRGQIPIMVWFSHPSLMMLVLNFFSSKIQYIVFVRIYKCVLS
jgi:hypothetical protein